ncbi:MAG: thioredoxin domain-containing protein [Pseudomonadota bacterium]
MLNKNSRNLAISLAAFVVIGTFALFLSKGYAAPDEQATETPPVKQAAAPTPPAEPAPSDKAAAGVPETVPGLLAPPAAAEIDVTAAMQDRILGRDTAPVTIIEYTSLTCSHCAYFSTKILPELKKSLFDTGKARLILRDFPLDNIALRASMMTRCVPADKYFSMTEVLFSNQARWMENKDPLTSLAQLGSLAGLDEAAFKNCTQSVALETAIVTGYQEAQARYDIKATPTFIFNDGAEKLTGAQNAAEFEEIVNKLTKRK